MGGDDAAVVEDRQAGQLVTLADLEVVRVVRGGHLDGAGAEGRIHMGIGDDRDATPGQRKFDIRADEVPVALVVRMNGDGGVAEHGLGPGGGDDDRVVTIAVPDGDSSPSSSVCSTSMSDSAVRHRGHQLMMRSAR